MKNLLNAYLVVLALSIPVALPAANQPVLRAGVSVEMPVTTSAVPMPDADTADALVAAVTRDGNLYLGIVRLSPAGLEEKLKSAFTGGAGKRLYLKADANAQFASVSNAVDAAAKAGLGTLNLLTAQRDTSETAYPVPPKGLEVLLGPSLPTASESVVVEARIAGERPELSVNNAPVSFDALRAALGNLLQTGGRKTVVVKAGKRLPFSDVIRIIDTCRSLNAPVLLATPAN